MASSQSLNWAINNQNSSALAKFRSKSPTWIRGWPKAPKRWGTTTSIQILNPQFWWPEMIEYLRQGKCSLSAYSREFKMIATLNTKRWKRQTKVSQISLGELQESTMQNLVTKKSKACLWVPLLSTIIISIRFKLKSLVQMLIVRPCGGNQSSKFTQQIQNNHLIIWNLVVKFRARIKVIKILRWPTRVTRVIT